jgi:hypothetical protein
VGLGKAQARTAPADAPTLSLAPRPPLTPLSHPPDAPGLSQQARFPADRRPLALHNVGLALDALRAAGVPTDTLPTARGLVALRAEDLVDGDRDRSLALLWAAARALQLPRLLKPATLRAEVARVLAGRRPGGRRPEAPLHVYMNDELAGLLMEWVAAVAGRHGVAVRNFTTCFGDGRVLCLLVRWLWVGWVGVGGAPQRGGTHGRCPLGRVPRPAGPCLAPAARLPLLTPPLLTPLLPHHTLTPTGRPLPAQRAGRGLNLRARPRRGPAAAPRGRAARRLRGARSGRLVRDVRRWRLRARRGRGAPPRGRRCELRGGPPRGENSRRRPGDAVAR